MIENVSVTEVMSKKPITLHPKQSIEDAKSVFNEFDIHHIPIVVLNKVVGILSLGDILFLDNIRNKNLDKHLNTMAVGVDVLDDIMTNNPICLKSTSSIKEALTTMTIKRINCLPIVNKEDEIVGLITTHDINTYLLKKLQKC